MSAPSSNKIGPYGGPGGNPFDITTPTKLVSVQVWSNDKVGEGVINGISFSYIKERGKPAVYSGPWGTKTAGKAPHQINLADDEHMIRVSGTTDGTYVTSLTFFTDQAKEYGPYGAQSREGLGTFSFPPNVVGFFGRSSDKLDAMGAHVIPT